MKAVIYVVTIFFVSRVHGKLEELLIGHLKPLGQQTPPSVKIDEYEEGHFPTPKEFYDNYMQNTKAVIFRGAVKNSKAFKLWTDDYMLENYGDFELRMEGKREKGNAGIPIGEKWVGRDSIKHFVNTYHKNNSNMYFVSDLPLPMYKEVGVIPNLGACGPMKERFVEIDIWWSGGNSRSVIHKDAYNQLNCLLNGTKSWKLFEYKYEKYIHKHWEPALAVGGYSDVNVDAVDLKKHPNITKVPWSDFTAHPGDCLYLPKSYYHQVVSSGTMNLAVSVLFGRFDGETSAELDFSDCTENTDYKSLVPLNEFEIDWSYSGNGALVMGQTDLHNFKMEMQHLVDEIYASGMDITKKVLKQNFGSEAANMFHLFDKNKDGKVTPEEVRMCTRAEWREFGTAMSEYEPSNNSKFEYSLLSYGEVLRLLMYALKKVSVLKREVWVRVYQNHIHGTAFAANEIFTKLAGSEEAQTIETKAIKPKDIQYGLENWITYFAPQYSQFRSVKHAEKVLGLFTGKPQSVFGNDDQEEMDEGEEDDEMPEDDKGDYEDEEKEMDQGESKQRKSEL